MSCGDVLNIEDLRTAKRHQVFEAEVITGRRGGVAGGAPIDTATNTNTGQVQKTLPAILRDIGFTPAGWDFSTGGTLNGNDRDKAVYDPVSHNWYKYAGTLPVTVAPGFDPTASADWKPVTDELLRADLASASAGKGASLVTTVDGKTVQDAVDLFSKRNALEVFLEDYPGVTGDGVVDDTAAIQAAVKDVATRGGGVIHGAFGAVYYIAGTVLLPTGVMFDLGGSTIKGEREASTTPTFETAYLVDGNLVSNITAEDETALVYNSGFRNGKVINCYLFLKAKNFIKGCELRDIDAFNCRQLVEGRRCFYSSYVNILVRGGSLPNIPMFSFADQNNAMYFERVSATVEYGFQFSQGTTAVVFDQCTFEGGSVGFDMQDDCYGVTWTGCYFEAVQGVLFRFLNAGTCTVHFTGNYVNLVDIVIQGTTANGYLFGKWDKSNAIVRVGESEGGFTYRGLVALDGVHDYLDMEFREEVGTTSADLPANVIAGLSSGAKVVRVLENTGPGDVFAKGIVTKGVIPVHYSGTVGQAAANTVPFCTHEAFAPGNPTVTVLLTTRIVTSDAVFAKFNLTLGQSSGSVRLFGDIYGTNLVRADTNTATNIAVTNAGGYLRLEIGPFTSAGGVYSLSGSVQICS